MMVVKIGSLFLVGMWFYFRASGWRQPPPYIQALVVIKSVSLRPNLDFTAMHAINTRNKKGLFLKKPAKYCECSRLALNSFSAALNLFLKGG